MKNHKEQVPLFKLVFNHSWEDPENDHEALKIKNEDTIMAITSGACNVLGFLMFDPKEIYSLDINPKQSYLLELKIAAMKTLNFDEYIKFMGLIPEKHRLRQYERIRPLLSKEANDFWNTQGNVLKKGLIMNGQYERFIKIAGTFIRFLQGRKRVYGLFAEKSQYEQQLYFDEIWNTKRFHYLFKVLFNKHMLAKRGLVADYFHFDDGSTSFSESFYNRSRKVFRDIPIRGNYFLSLYLLGKYQSMNEVPNYLKEENYELIKSRLDRITIITDEAQSWLASRKDNSIDCFALSNICELMSETETHRLFSQVQKKAKNGSRVIFRNLMIPREVPESLKESIVKNEYLSKKMSEEDRSFVYSKVAAYEISK